MKTKSILRIFLTAVFVLGTFAIHAQTKVYVHKSDGLSEEYNIADIDSISLNPRETLEPGWNNVTASSGLKNTSAPFANDGVSVFWNVFSIKDWTVNPALAANGTVNLERDYAIAFMVVDAWGIYSPSQNIVNGKLFQTVKLGAGKYEFSIEVRNCHNLEDDVVFFGAALGNDLPDADAMEGPKALNFVAIPAGWYGPSSGPDWVDTPVSCEFELSEASIVSLGFLIPDMKNLNMVHIAKVELWKYYE